MTRTAGGYRRATPTAIKVNQALATLVQMDGRPWTHGDLCRELRDQSALLVTPEQVARIRAGELDTPPRLIEALSRILRLPLAYFADTTDPVASADALHTAAALLRHPDLSLRGSVPRLTDLAEQLTAVAERPDR